RSHVTILSDLSTHIIFQGTRARDGGRDEGAGVDGRGRGGGLAMRQRRLVPLGGIRSGFPRFRRSGVLLTCLLWLVVVGCASQSLMPAAQSQGIRDREQALAPHRDAIQASVQQAGNVGALAFLDAKEGRLVVLPGDSPVDAWERYAASPDGQSSSASMPEVVTFVYRTDIPKAPEAVILSDLQQQQARRTALEAEFRRFDEQLNLMQRQLGDAMAVTKQDTDKAVVDMRALADDLAATRKFMVQTAQ